MDHAHDLKDWWKGLSWPLAVYRAGLASSFHRSGDGLQCAEDHAASRMLTQSYVSRRADGLGEDLGRSFAQALHPYSWLATASRMNGTPVFDRKGRPAGHVSDLSLEKTSGQVIYALVAIGGGAGRPEFFYPLPWWLLQYDRRKKGYVAPVPLSTIEAGPCLSRDEVEWFGADDSAWRERLEIYYSPYAHPVL